MGNALSYNSIWVACDKPSHTAGDVVRGVACLNLVQDAEVTSVQLKVTGFERTCYKEAQEFVQPGHKGKAKVETVYIPRHGRRSFFKERVTLGPAGTYPAGHYQFGFAFRLPENCPSSFAWDDGECRGGTFYKVKTCLYTGPLPGSPAAGGLPGVLPLPGAPLPPGGVLLGGMPSMPDLAKPALKGKQELVVLQRPRGSPVSVVQSAEVEINLCGCIRQGRAVAQVEVDRPHYLPGEAVLLRLHTSNQSKEDFPQVKVKLKQQVTLVADGAAKKKTLRECVQDCAFQGVPSGTTLQGQHARQMGFPIPPGLPATSHGQITACDYWCTVKLKGRQFVSPLKVLLPIILHPTPAPDVLLQPPPTGEWRPSQVLDPVAVQLPNAPPLPPEALDPKAAFWMATKGLDVNGQPLPPPPPPLPQQQQQVQVQQAQTAAVAQQPWMQPPAGMPPGAVQLQQAPYAQQAASVAAQPGMLQQPAAVAAQPGMPPVPVQLQQAPYAQKAAAVAAQPGMPPGPVQLHQPPYAQQPAAVAAQLPFAQQPAAAAAQPGMLQHPTPHYPAVRTAPLGLQPVAVGSLTPMPAGNRGAVR